MLKVGTHSFFVLRIGGHYLELSTVSYDHCLFDQGQDCNFQSYSEPFASQVIIF